MNLRVLWGLVAKKMKIKRAGLGVRVARTYRRRALRYSLLGVRAACKLPIENVVKDYDLVIVLSVLYEAVPFPPNRCILAGIDQRHNCLWTTYSNGQSTKGSSQGIRTGF